jgi:hypothetical protein
MLAVLCAFVVVAAGAGVFWLFVFGDDPWPASANTVLMGVAVIASALTWIALVAAGYRFGRHRETTGGVRRRHVLVMLAVSVLLPLLVLLQQWQVGHFGAGR